MRKIIEIFFLAQLSYALLEVGLTFFTSN